MRDGARWPPCTLRLTPYYTSYASHRTPCTIHLTPHTFLHLTPHTSHLAPYVLLATRHLPPTHFLLARGVRPARGCGGAARVGGALIRCSRMVDPVARAESPQTAESLQSVAELRCIYLRAGIRNGKCYTRIPFFRARSSLFCISLTSLKF